MRAERLASVVREIDRHLSSAKPVERLSALVTALQNQASAPTAEAQAATAAALAALRKATMNSPLDILPSSDASILRSMKLPPAFGQALDGAVLLAMSGNQLTPQSAANTLKTVLEQAKNVKQEIANGSAALEYFEVKPDELKAGEFEVMVEIPGMAIHDELNLFGKETLSINKILVVYNEIATGTREPLKLRAIGSSNPTLYIYLAGGAATIIVNTLERLVSLYDKVLGIVRTHRELQKNDVPADVTDPLKVYIQAQVSDGLARIQSDIEQENSSGFPADRKRELQTELAYSLKELAKRLDQGYLFDVKAGPSAEGEPQDDVARASIERDERAREVVQAARPSIRHFEPVADPILGLAGGTEADSG